MHNHRLQNHLQKGSSVKEMLSNLQDSTLVKVQSQDGMREMNIEQKV